MLQVFFTNLLYFQSYWMTMVESSSSTLCIFNKQREIKCHYDFKNKQIQKSMYIFSILYLSVWIKLNYQTKLFCQNILF